MLGQVPEWQPQVSRQGMARQGACHEAQSCSHPAPIHAILSLKAAILVYVDKG